MDKILRSIADICQSHSVSKALLFGSRARGDFSPTSDYDVAIWCEKDIRPAITEDIADIDTLYKIDVVFVDEHTDKQLLENILKDGVGIVDKALTKISNYKKAVVSLKEAIDEYRQTDSKTVRDGVIQRFEFTTELAWKSLREYLVDQGFQQSNSPKSVMQDAFAAHFISDEQSWISILNDRNLTSHIYDDSVAEEVCGRIINEHLKAFESLFAFYDREGAKG